MKPKNDPIIKKLIDCPLTFDLKDHKSLYDKIYAGKLQNSVIRAAALQILDLSEDGIYKSTADKGIIGFLNARSRNIRQNRYRRLIKANFRQYKDNTVILAEGDSWFEHPLVMDILDHLEFHNDVAIYSLAYGADWLDNIIFQGEYIDQISLLHPEVFMVSGGGNDIIESGKLAIFLKNNVIRNRPEREQHYQDLILRYPAVAKWTPDFLDVRATLKKVGPEFFGLLNILLFQYYYLFHSVQQKYPDMIFLTQGYDYACPKPKIRRNPLNLFQWSINTIMNNGKWIDIPMKQSLVFAPEQMHDAIKLFIGLFNEGLIELAQTADIKKLYHIDNRSIANDADWFDEIHIKDYRYLQVAETYYHAIKTIKNKTAPDDKIFRAADIWNPDGHNKAVPSFAFFIKGFIRTSPRLSTLFGQLAGCLLLIGLWWLLFPSSETCSFCWTDSMLRSMESRDHSGTIARYIEPVLNSCKLPFSLFVIGIPLLVYIVRIIRAVVLSIKFSNTKPNSQ